MGRLQGKRALITGATSGIGLETARHFVREGARVAITGHNMAGLEAAGKELGPEVLAIAADASNVGEQDRLVEQLRQAFDKLDVVFVNAGIAELRPIEKWDEASFDRTMALNLKGPFFLIRALLPILEAKASIVLNGSVNAHVGMPTSSVYAASKAALMSLTRTLSGELIGRGVRVNAISPGPIETPLYDKLGVAGKDRENLEAFIRGQVPAGRFGRAAEIAQAVVYLASDESEFVVGADLQIDGGMGTL